MTKDELVKVLEDAIMAQNNVVALHERPYSELLRNVLADCDKVSAGMEAALTALRGDDIAVLPVRWEEAGKGDFPSLTLVIGANNRAGIIHENWPIGFKWWLLVDGFTVNNGLCPTLPAAKSALLLAAMRVGVCDCEAPSAFTSKLRCARKPHVCCECGETIPVGAEYHCFSGDWQHVPGRYHTCLDCDDARGKYKSRLDPHDCYPCFGELWASIWYGEGIKREEWLRLMREGKPHD
jgi:hypothetical protein